MNHKLNFFASQAYTTLSHHFEPTSLIKIDHFADSLLKLQIEIGVHLTNVELTQLLTLHTQKQQELQMQVLRRQQEIKRLMQKQQEIQRQHAQQRQQWGLIKQRFIYTQKQQELQRQVLRRQQEIERLMQKHEEIQRQQEMQKQQFLYKQKQMQREEELKKQPQDPKGGTVLYRRVNGVFVAMKQWY